MSEAATRSGAIDGVEVVAFVCHIPGDVDGDHDVDFADLLALLAARGPCPHHAGCPEDLDNDGLVGFGDLLLLLAAWGPCS